MWQIWLKGRKNERHPSVRNIIILKIICKGNAKTCGNTKQERKLILQIWLVTQNN